MSIKDDALRLAALKVLKDQVGDEYEATRERLHAAMTQADATQLKPKVNGEQVATVFLGGGSVRTSVRDEDALIDWAATEYPAEVETVTVTRLRPGFRARLLAEAKRAGAPVNAMGEVLPGVAVSESEPYVSARIVDGGAETLIAAWRSGLLPELLPPAEDESVALPWVASDE